MCEPPSCWSLARQRSCTCDTREDVVERPETYDVIIDVLGKSQTVVCALVSERQQDLVEIRRLMEAGTPRTVVDRSFPLEQAAEAHRYAESGAKTGSVVITVARPTATSVHVESSHGDTHQ